MTNLDGNAIEKISELATTASEKRIIEKDGNTFLANGNGEVRQFIPAQSNQWLHTHTLSSVVDYIKQGPENDGKFIISIPDERTVLVVQPLDKYKRRELRLRADAIVPEFEYDNFYDVEELNIKLQSQFLKSEDRDLILKLIGNIKEESSQTSADDGVSQVVSARTGVASISKVIVPNPVKLAPYRSFTEIDQVPSSFVFRMDKGPTAALFEADGGQWRTQAIAEIKQYLTDQLGDDVCILG